MTKVTILGQEPEKKDLKPIEFVKKFKTEIGIFSAEEPCEWDNIVLLKRKVKEDLDLMYAYDNNNKSYMVVLGHFNDGIV